MSKPSYEQVVAKNKELQEQLEQLQQVQAQTAAPSVCMDEDGSQEGADLEIENAELRHDLHVYKMAWSVANNYIEALLQWRNAKGWELTTSRQKVESIKQQYEEILKNLED